jgi:hypothetical protein
LGFGGGVPFAFFFMDSMVVRWGSRREMDGIRPVVLLWSCGSSLVSRIRCRLRRWNEDAEEWRRQGVAKPVWREGLGGSRSTVYTGHERRTLEFSRATNSTQEVFTTTRARCDWRVNEYV